MSWIKISSNLVSHPKVFHGSALLGVTRYDFVGRLLAFWGWADSHTTDGQNLSITQEGIDSVVQCPGFAAALMSIGWLAGGDWNMSIPRFEEHNGSTAKRRAVDAARKSRERELSAKCPKNFGQMSEKCPEYVREVSNEFVTAGFVSVTARVEESEQNTPRLTLSASSDLHKSEINAERSKMSENCPQNVRKISDKIRTREEKNREEEEIDRLSPIRGLLSEVAKSGVDPDKAREVIARCVAAGWRDESGAAISNPAAYVVRSVLNGGSSSPAVITLPGYSDGSQGASGAFAGHPAGASEVKKAKWQVDKDILALKTEIEAISHDPKNKVGGGRFLTPFEEWFDDAKQSDHFRHLNTHILPRVRERVPANMLGPDGSFANEPATIARIGIEYGRFSGAKAKDWARANGWTDPDALTDEAKNRIAQLREKIAKLKTIKTV